MKKGFLLKITAVLTVFGCAFCSFGVNASAATVDYGRASKSYSTYKREAKSDYALPSSYSSKDLGYVTGVKYQLNNDCWAYAGLAAFESKLLHDGFKIGDMSVEHLNAWATKHSDGTGWQRNTSGDGYAEITLGYLTSWQGGVEESDLTGFEISNQIAGELVPTNLAKYGTTGIEYLYGENPERIKSMIVDNGGVYTSYSSSYLCLSTDSTSYFMPEQFEGPTIGHAIEIVGWDDNYDRNNFTGIINALPENNGAWLAKNSWGNNNSLGGYFWISYEDKYIFSQKYEPSYSITSVQEIDENTKINQNEIFGATYDFDYVNENKITYLNKFNFSNGYNTLEKVIFETVSAGADYSIHYVPVKNNRPITDESQWIPLCEGTIDYNGYICTDIDNFEIPLGNGAIAVTIDTTSLNSEAASDESLVKNTFGVGEWMNKADGTPVFINKSKQGDSYIYYNGVMTDLLDWYKENRNDEQGGTFVIKAVTTGEGPYATLIGDVDLNGKISILDATAIQKYLVSLTSLSDIEKLNADFNGDGKISILDATAIQKHLVGLI